MNNSGIRRSLRRFLRKLALIDLIIVITIIIIGKYNGWQNIEPYSTALTWAGVASIVFGLVTGIGGVSSRGEDLAAFAITGAGKKNEHQRLSVLAFEGQFGFLFLMSAAGVILIAMGYLLEILG